MHPMMLGVALPVAAIYVGYVLAVSLTGTLWLNVNEKTGAVRVRQLRHHRHRLACCGRSLKRPARKRLSGVNGRAATNVDRSERERTTAELKALRAQVEPHFLYNTLSNVVSLIEREPGHRKVHDRAPDRLCGIRWTPRAARTPPSAMNWPSSATIWKSCGCAWASGSGTRSLPITPRPLAAAVAHAAANPLVENAIKHGLEPKSKAGALCQCRGAGWRAQYRR